MFDATNSYDIPFYMAGGFLVISSFISFLAPVIRRRTTKDLMSPLPEMLDRIDENEEDQIPDIVETDASPQSTEEVKQLESVL